MKRENPFKQIGQPPKEVPTELKQKVLTEVISAKRLMDMAASFAFNYKRSLGSLFLTKKERKNN